MDIFKVMYRLPDGTVRELCLDVRARRWTLRAIVRAVIRHEYPYGPMPEMRVGKWTPDQVLRPLGIHDLAYTFVTDSDDRWASSLAESGVLVPIGQGTVQNQPYMQRQRSAELSDYADED